MSFFFAAHNDFLEEIAKFRAARRLWARIMRDRFGVDEPARAAAALSRPDGRQHADGSAARQQPRARGASRRWPPCSAARSRCTATAATRRWRFRRRNPRRSRCARSRSSRANRASRTRSIPSAARTRSNAGPTRSKRRRERCCARIEAAGGTLAAIESGMIQREIQESAFRAQRAIDSGEPSSSASRGFRPTRARRFRRFASIRRSSACSRSGVRAVRAARDAGRWRAALEAVRRAAAGRTRTWCRRSSRRSTREATVGEISDTLRDVFGEHREVVQTRLQMTLRTPPARPGA